MLYTAYTVCCSIRYFFLPWVCTLTHFFCCLPPSPSSFFPFRLPELRPGSEFVRQSPVTEDVGRVRVAAAAAAAVSVVSVSKSGACSQPRSDGRSRYHPPLYKSQPPWKQIRGRSKQRNGAEEKVRGEGMYVDEIACTHVSVSIYTLQYDSDTTIISSWHSIT